MRIFEANLHRVQQLMEIPGQLAKGPGKPAQWRSDIARAAIVMTIAAVDTYFDDRLRTDFERRFEKLEPNSWRTSFRGWLLQQMARSRQASHLLRWRRRYRTGTRGASW